MPIALLVIAIIIVIMLITRVRIVPEARKYVVERLGKYHATWDTGIHFLVPFLDHVSANVSMKEQVADFPPQPVITKDNVTMQIDTIVFYQIVNAMQYKYGIDDPARAIEALTATTLRNVVGSMDLDATLTSRDSVNQQITAILDEATDPWGLKVTRVELKNIIPPREIQDAMEKQMKAERERREKLLQAEGDKTAAILVAEGDKKSKILAAEADKESAVLRAEAEKQAAILKAEAEKQKKVLEAEGEAEAIEKLNAATARGIEMLNASQPTQAILALKSFEALEKVANGRATKLIIPSEIQNLASTIAAVKGTVDGLDSGAFADPEVDSAEQVLNLHKADTYSEPDDSSEYVHLYGSDPDSSLS